MRPLSWPASRSTRDLLKSFGWGIAAHLPVRIQNSTIIVVVELSQSNWLVGGVVPGIERQPRKKLEPSPTSPIRAL
jgi:hypothetical protein